MAGMLQQPSQQAIKDWFAYNPNATDVEIAGAMKTHNLGTANVAQALGVDHRMVQNRYATATGNTVLAQATAPTQQQPAPPAQSTLGRAWTPDMMNANSSAAEISGTYSNWAKQNGGDTEANRATANQFLRGKGLSQNSINGAYDQFKGAGMLAQNAPGPTAGQQATFKSLMDQGDYHGSAKFARSLGFDDDAISQYVGAGNFQDVGGRISGQNASDFLRSNQPGGGRAAGTPPFGAMTATQSAMTGITQAPIPRDVTMRAVNEPRELIEGRIQGLLGTDANGNYTNPVVQQAAQMAMQQFAGRGLLNSSMAVQAASQAAISKAIEIAGPDAQTMFSQGRANQDALNVFARDKIGNDFTASQQDKLFGQQDKQQDKELAQRGSEFDREFGLKGQEVAQRASQFDRELAYKFEAMKFDTESRTLATEVAQKNALEINNIKSVNDQYDLYLRRISEIEMNKELLGPAKLKAKNDAGKDFDVFARAAKIVWETMGGRYEEADPDAPKKPAPTDPTAATGGLLFNPSDGP